MTKRNQATGWFDELAAFEYNGDGLRVSQTADGDTTAYVWDVSASSTGSVAAGLPQVLVEGPYAYTYGHTVLDRIALGSGQSMHYNLDGLGSVRQAVDHGTGQVLDSYRYAPFGALMSGGGTDNTRRYTGETHDPATNLIYLRARYYDASIGRFLTQDTFPGYAFYPATQHPYVYVMNNPVNLVDPSGHIPQVVVAIIVGAAFGAAGGAIQYIRDHPGKSPGDYLTSGDFWKSVLKGAAGWCRRWAVCLGVGAMFGGAAAASFGGSVISGAAAGASGAGAGQIFYNLLDPCRKWHEGVLEAMLFGGVTGGAIGGVGYGIRQWRISQAANYPRERLVLGGVSLVLPLILEQERKLGVLLLIQMGM